MNIEHFDAIITEIDSDISKIVALQTANGSRFFFQLDSLQGDSRLVAARYTMSIDRKTDANVDGLDMITITELDASSNQSKRTVFDIEAIETITYVI